VDDLFVAVKREFLQVYDLKKSNPMAVGGNRKQQATWNGNGSDRKKNGSGGGGGLKNDGDRKNGKKNFEKEFLVLMIFLGLDEFCG